MKNEPLISIICPVYNKESYLSDCILFLTKQKYNNWELILVDDGSTDNSPMICDNFALQDSRINCIHQTNKGHSESRNVGIRNSNGEYLMFIDADDMLFDDNVLELMMAECLDKALDVCISEISTLTLSGELKKSTYKFLDLPYESLTGTQVLCLMIEKNNYHATMCSRLFKKSLILENGLYFKNMICDDEEWTPQIFCLAKKIGFIPHNGYIIRKDENSVTGKRDVKTYLRKINDKAVVTVMLMKTFDNIRGVTVAQKKVLYNKFFSFINMAYYSLMHDVKDCSNREIINHLIECYKQIRQYYNLLDIKNKIKYTRSIVRLKFINK